MLHRLAPESADKMPWGVMKNSALEGQPVQGDHPYWAGQLSGGDMHRRVAK